MHWWVLAFEARKPANKFKRYHVMKALYLKEFCAEGTVADSIQFGDFPLPTTSPQKTEVLIEVKASAINVDDVAMCQNTAMGGWFAHMRTPTESKPVAVGTEYSGVVLAVGPDVKRLKVGDRVCGVHSPISKTLAGTWAEQTLGLEKDIVRIPSDCDLSFVQAAAIGTSAFVCGDMYRRANFPAGGARCLLIGASGGLGTALLQLVRSQLGDQVHIAAVCSGSNVEMVTRLGADEVIDYRKGPVIDQLADHDLFDIVFDLVGGTDYEQVAAKVLKRRGQFITGVGPMRAIGDRMLSCCEFSGWACGLLGRLLRSMCCCCCGIKYEMAGGLPPLKAEDFNLVVVEAGVRPEIGLEVPFAEKSLREALALVSSRHTKGKVVMNMERRK